MNPSFSKFCNLSLICADPLSLRDDLTYLSKLGLKRVHLDIMDAEFVPRFGLYPEISLNIQNEFEFIFDAHFMVSDVVKSLREWRKYHNPSKVSFHFKGNEDRVYDILDEIRSGGSEALLAVDLSIQDGELIDVLNKHTPDGVMLLGITPGVLQQIHQPDKVLQRLKLLKNLALSLPTIQIDGGVNFSSISELIADGATELICGSSTIYKDVRFENKIIKRQLLLRNVEKFEACLSV